MTRLEICKLIISEIRNFIYSDACLEAHRLPKHFVRKRLLSFAHVIMYLLSASKAKMETNISELLESLDPDSFPSVSKQAISKARQGILPSLFREIFQISVDLFYKNFTRKKLWHGLHVFAIDGSKIQLPNSDSNFAEFGKMFSLKNPNREWSMALSSIVYDVLDDYIVHASLGRYLASERSFAKQHLAELEQLDIYKDSIVVFDRGYYSEDMFRYCAEHGHLCLMRLKKSFRMSKSCDGDTRSVLPGNTGKSSDDIDIRVIAVTLCTGETEFLATNLFDPAFTADMFRELYFLRWSIEIKYLELKEYLKLEEFNGATAVSIEQEFYITLLISNLTALIKADADEAISNNQKPTNRHRYQSKRTFILSRIKKVLPQIIFGLNNPDYIDVLLEEASRTRSQLQPGRHDPRPKKSGRRERKHFNNRKAIV